MPRSAEKPGEATPVQFMVPCHSEQNWTSAQSGCAAAAPKTSMVLALRKPVVSFAFTSEETCLSAPILIELNARPVGPGSPFPKPRAMRTLVPVLAFDVIGDRGLYALVSAGLSTVAALILSA